MLSKKKTLFTGNVYVCVGGDNRPSTPRIIELIKQGIKSQGGIPLDFGLITTPQLFFYGKYTSIQFNISTIILNLKCFNLSSNQNKQNLYLQNIGKLLLSHLKFAKNITNINQSRKEQ